MKILKKRGDTSTLRKVVSDDYNTFWGVYGSAKDFVNMGIVEGSLGRSINMSEWIFIPNPEMFQPLISIENSHLSECITAKTKADLFVIMQAEYGMITGNN